MSLVNQLNILCIDQISNIVSQWAIASYHGKPLDFITGRNILVWASRLMIF